MTYLETEYKILDVDPTALSIRLEELGAVKVFDGERTITSFQNTEGSLLSKGIHLKMTSEGKEKLSCDVQQDGVMKSMKVTVSRKQEMMDIFAELGIIPIAEVKAWRTSYELDGVDYDIDTFPGIPSFLEVDPEETSFTEEHILTLLELVDKEVLRASTPEIFAHYDRDYFEIFKIR